MDINPYNDLPPDSVIFGKSSLMLELEGKMRKVLGTNLPVLLQGESGTGKRTLSRFIHQNSKSLDGPYLRVNCATHAGTLLETMPFTLVADEFQQDSTIFSSGLDFSAIGTLFLDDVAELSPKSQLHLFHSLPDGHDSGSDGKPNPWAASRLVSATSRDLRREVNEQRFRRDLFYRLAVVTFEVPPLRNRMDDLLTIADHLRRQYSEHFGVSHRPFPDSLVERMHHHGWPGNIRELENFICRFVVLGPEEPVLGELSSNHESALAGDGNTSSETLLKDVTRRTLANLEREMIRKALDQHQGNLKRAADTLGISYRTLMNKMDQVGLPRTRHGIKSRESLES